MRLGCLARERRLKAAARLAPSRDDRSEHQSHLLPHRHRRKLEEALHLMEQQHLRRGDARRGGRGEARRGEAR